MISGGLERLRQDEIRVDGVEKVSGQAKYSADFSMEGMLWAAFLRSTVPYARIARIDVSAARAIPGVHAVLTGTDIGERYLGRILFDWPVLAFDKVRFVGDHVAAVAAETPEIAEAAIAAIDVAYDELTPIFDPAESMASTEYIHDRAGQYVYFPGNRPPVPHPNVHGYDLSTIGDVDAGFAEAARVFEHTFTTPRSFAAYLEPRACLVWIDANDVVHVVSTNKSPFGLREQLAITTGRRPETIVIEPSFIGGDFGSKGLSIEEFQCYFLAQATKRPVKHVRSYADDMRATVTRHAAQITVRSGVDADGRFVALDARFLYNGGAYIAGRPIPSLIPGAKVKTPYFFRNSRIERFSVYTNTVPAGQVRDPAGVPLVFAIESHVDMVARELGIDPLEFRLRNAIRDDQRDVDGTSYAQARAVDVLEGLRDAVDWGKPLPKGHGRGISLSSRHVGGGKTSMKLRLRPDETIEIHTGVTEQGVGTLTLAARVVATVLDVDPQRIRVARYDTASVPRDPGPGGSRATHLLGRAAYDAAEKLRAALESGATAPIEVVGTYDDEHKRGDPEWHNFCAYCFEVSIDRETGAIEIHDVVFVADVGTVINPLGHRGQLNGGFAFGLGHGMTEEIHVENGRLLNLSLADYKIPTVADMPPFRIVMLPTNLGPGPFGAKMAGELSTASVPATIANAVADACGVRITALPVTAERIFAGLRGVAE